jgi:hypothetical protein
MAMSWREILNTDKILPFLTEKGQELGSSILPKLIKRACRPSDLVCKATDNYSLESILPSPILSVTDFAFNHPYLTLFGTGVACGAAYLYKHPEAQQAITSRLPSLRSRPHLD